MPKGGERFLRFLHRLSNPGDAVSYFEDESGTDKEIWEPQLRNFLARLGLLPLMSAMLYLPQISGHNDLGTLQRYLEVTPEQRKKAVSVIGF
ncbi:MAG: hypothetical protein V7K48_17665 [Nostoc sp.]|uniref:hypothetical protein n=1 Tax=Nostoc sp. TaxID=1180 RepID=UPI002FF9409E